MPKGEDKSLMSLPEKLDSKSKKAKLSMDLDTSDVSGTTEVRASSQKTAEVSAPAVVQEELATKLTPEQTKKATPLQLSKRKTTEVTDEFRKKFPGITRILDKTFIPVEAAGCTVMRELGDCTGAEFLSWAQRALPLGTTIDPSHYDDLGRREKAFGIIVRAHRNQFLFGGPEYRKRHLWN